MFGSGFEERKFGSRAKIIESGKIRTKINSAQFAERWSHEERHQRIHINNLDFQIQITISFHINIENKDIR